MASPRDKLKRRAVQCRWPGYNRVTCVFHFHLRAAEASDHGDGMSTVPARRLGVLLLLIPGLLMFLYIFLFRNVACHIEVANRMVSPDSRYVATLKVRRCAGPVGSATLVDIERVHGAATTWLERQARFWLPSPKLQAEELFRENAVGDKVDIAWTAPNVLRIRYDDRERRFPLCRPTWADIQIECEAENVPESQAGNR